jgi:TonB family protein
VFPEAAAAAKTPTPAARVESAGFDAPVKQTTETKLAPATVGAFDSATNAGARQPGSANAANTVVTESGFARPAASVPSSTPQSRVVRDSGFGTSASREQPKSAQPPAEVKAAGFGAAAVADNTKRSAAPPPPPSVTPVEVLFKPTPIYTEEARKLKLEGDVVLEVDFLSSGALRVIRVVRGLGHGLDEAAVKAAEQIRFKPAQDSGRAVDSRTTVSIVFRLA